MHGSQRFPENTSLTFQEAIEVRAEVIESDIRSTKKEN